MLLVASTPLIGPLAAASQCCESFLQAFLPHHQVAQEPERSLRIAELGPGKGEFSLSLARQFPKTTVFAIDRASIPFPPEAQRPDNLVDMGEHSFERFLAISGMQHSFDLVYAISPDPPNIRLIAETAARLVTSGGQVYALLDPYDGQRLTQHLSALGFVCETDLVEATWAEGLTQFAFDGSCLILPDASLLAGIPSLYGIDDEEDQDLMWVRAERPVPAQS